MKKYIKHIAVLYLIYSIVAYPLIAYSNTLAGWNIDTVVRNGATTLYNASKTLVLNGSSVVVNSSAAILPVASEVALMIARNATGLAVLYAVSQLIPAGINYINDSVNKKFTYTPPQSKLPQDNPSYQYYYSISTGQFGGFICNAYTLSDVSSCATAYGNFIKTAANLPAFSYNNEGCSFSAGAYTCESHNQYNDAIQFSFVTQANPYYNPNASPPVVTEQSVTYEQVGAKIISNANAGNADAINYVGTVADTTQEANPANQIVKPQTVVNQFEQNINYTVNNTAGAVTNASSVTNRVTTNASGAVVASSVASSVEASTTNITLPAFCSYAPMLCDFLGWVKDDKLPVENENQPVELVAPDVTFNQNVYISPNQSCPAPTIISFGGINIPVDYSMFCNVLEIIKPAVISVAFISAIFIVSGVRDNG